MAAVVGLGQPASAAEIDARTPVPSKTASPPTGKEAADKKKTAQRKAADKATGTDKATAKPQRDPKAADATAKRPHATSTDTAAGKAGASRTDPAKAGRAAVTRAEPTPSPTPPPSTSPAPSTAAAAVAPSVAAAESPSIAENGVLAITSAESLNGDVDVEVTWGEYAAAQSIDFYWFLVTTDTGNYTCQTSMGVWNATTCTIDNVAPGTYSFTVTAVFEGGDVVSTAYPQTVGESDPAPQLTATFRDSTMVDHDWTAVKFAMNRTDTTDAAEALGFTATLPAGLVIADTNTSATCIGEVALEEGGSTIAMSDATINAGTEECTLSVSVTTSSSGSYQVTSGSISGLAGGLTNSVTPQTLTVTAADPTIYAEFNPTTVAAKAIALLRVGLQRADENPTSERAGIGYQLTLPGGLLVAAGQTANTCQGQLTAGVGSGTVTVSGVTITADGECYVQVPVSAAAGGSYSLDDSDFSNLTHADPEVMTGCQNSLPGIAGEGCGPTLMVTKLAQAITFTPAATVPLANGTMPLQATAGSELAVSFSASPEPVCTVSGTTLTLVGVGTCQITATQGGNGTFDAAAPVQRDVVVVPAPPAAPTLTAGVSSLTATWSAPQNTTGITGYRVNASPGQATCTTTTATSCVLGGTAGTTYTVTVVALVGDDASAASPASNQATPTAPQPPAAVPDTDLTLTTDQGIITTADPGEQIVFIGTGFAPFSTVVISIYSAPTVLGTTVTDALGNFSKPITIPRSLAAGAHTAVAQGVAPDGSPRSMKLAIQVVTSGGDGGLAVTGAPIALILLLGLGLVAAGAGVRRLSRRP